EARAATGIATREAASTRSSGAARRARKLFKIETVEIHSRAGPIAPARSASGAPGRDVVRIKAVLIVNFALLGIVEDAVGFLHVLKAVFGYLIARIEIRVMFARKAPIGLPDLFRRGLFPNA